MRTQPVFPDEGIPGDDADLQRLWLHLERLADTPLALKKPVGGNEQKVAVVLWGPPGSGKTTYAKAFLAQNPNYVPVAYDDGPGGALFLLDAYNKARDTILRRVNQIDEPVEAQEKFVKELRPVFLKYRPAAQQLRSRVLNKAVAGGHHLLIDITASGAGTTKMFDVLRKHGYAIELHGVYTPASVAEARWNSRGDRVLEDDMALYKKRIGCLENLGVLADAADRVLLHVNDQRHQPARRVYERTTDGKLHYDTVGLKGLLQMFAGDALFFTHHPSESVQGLTENMRGASRAAIECLTGKVLEASPLMQPDTPSGAIGGKPTGASPQ